MGLSKHSLRLLPIAEQDLHDILSYIAAENFMAASALADRMEGALRRLASHPALGRVPDDEQLSGMGYRFLVVENYLIFYTVRAKTILVHRILHGARDIRHLL